VSIPDSGPLNYKCDTSDYVCIEPDGSVLIGFPSEQFMKTPSGAFKPPLKIEDVSDNRRRIRAALDFDLVSIAKAPVARHSRRPAMDRGTSYARSSE
jgi:hypothetical protein